MQEPWTTPAKRLGWLNQPDFCPRCFYLQKLIGFKKPWPIPMPIYTALDRIQKQIVETAIHETGAPPPWLTEVGPISGYIDPPHHSKFFFDTKAGVRVRGQADLILTRPDGTLAIVDLKTSRSAGRDALLPTYHVQQNAYALAAEAQGLGKVASISLLYLGIEPEASLYTSIGGNAGDAVAIFKAVHHQLELDPSCIEPLCERYRELMEANHPPDPAEGCKECCKFEYIFTALSEPKMSLATNSVTPTRELFAKYLGMRR